MKIVEKRTSSYEVLSVVRELYGDGNVILSDGNVSDWIVLIPECDIQTIEDLSRETAMKAAKTNEEISFLKTARFIF